jgi:hypothetical protein
MSKITMALSAVFIFLVTGIGFAQETDPALAQPTTDGNNARPLENLPAEVQIEEGRSVVEYGKSLSERVSNMLTEARKESDIIRITCLNDKLTQINANLRNAQQRLQALIDATDRESRNHEYTVLMVLKQKFKTLDQEAGQCVGQDIYEIGHTQVTTEIDPSATSMDESPTATPRFGPSIATTETANPPAPATGND